MRNLSQPYFWNEQAARAKLEEVVWPSGPVCPFCGASDRIGAVGGKGGRAGLKFCCRCRKQFRATIGTLFEGSHVPLHKWFQAVFLLTASNSAISIHRLHLSLEVANKTASSMGRRINGVLNRGGHDGGTGGFGGDSWTETFGRKRMGERPILTARYSLAAGSATAANAAGNADMPWTTAAIRSLERLPAASTRQFLAFLDAAQAFVCSEEDIRFDEALARLGRCRARSPPRSPSLARAEPGFASGRLRREREILAMTADRPRPDLTPRRHKSAF